MSPVRRLLPLALTCAACVSINPDPPHAKGVQWSRYELTQGRTPQEFATSRATIRGESNRRRWPRVERPDYRYRLEMEVIDGGARSSVVCEQDRDRAVYRCEAEAGGMALELANDCTTGTLTSAGREHSLTAWFHEETHVGFLVSAQGRPRAAIDTDHQRRRPVWAARDLSRAELVDLDVVGYVVNDIFEAESSAGYPFLCGDLAASRRYPR